MKTRTPDPATIDTVRDTLAAGGSTADLARRLGVTWGTAKHHRTRYETSMQACLAKRDAGIPLAALRVVVELDVVLALSISSSHASKLAAGVVLTRTATGVSLAWGKQIGRHEHAQIFASVDAAIAWLTKRAEGMRACAAQCPGTCTATYSLDRAAFLSAACTIVRRYAPRLWPEVSP